MSVPFMNDYIFRQTKWFIENHINSGILSDDAKNKFTEYYESLTPHNANEVFVEVYQMHRCADIVFRRENAITIFYYVFLFALILALFRVVCKNYVTKNTRLYNILEFVYNIGLCGIIANFLAILLVFLIIPDDKRCVVKV